MNEYKKVLDDLMQISMFCGKYDKENGSEDFMEGISTVMEYIAEKAGCGEEFTDLFMKNFLGEKS